MSDYCHCIACLVTVNRLETVVSPDDVVNVVGEFDSDGICRITDQSHFMIVSPDRLLSGTSVVSSVHCMRRFCLHFSDSCLTFTSKQCFESIDSVGHSSGAVEYSRLVFWPSVIRGDRRFSCSICLLFWFLELYWVVYFSHMLIFVNVAQAKWLSRPPQKWRVYVWLSQTLLTQSFLAHLTVLTSASGLIRIQSLTSIVEVLMQWHSGFVHDAYLWTCSFCLQNLDLLIRNKSWRLAPWQQLLKCLEDE